MYNNYLDKAEMEYQKDIDRFIVDIGETKVKTEIAASPTGIYNELGRARKNLGQFVPAD